MRFFLSGLLFVTLFQINLRSIDPREKIRKLESVLDTGAFQNQIPLLLELIEACKKYEPEKTLKYGAIVIEISEGRNDWKNKGFALIHMSYAYRRLLKGTKSRQTINSAVELFERKGAMPGLLEAKLQSVILFQLDGWYETALKDALSALSIARNLGDTAKIAFCHYQIGVIFFNLEKYEQAMSRYKSALALAIQAGHQMYQGLVLNNIGLLYDFQGRYEKALVFFREAYGVFEEIDDQEWLSYLNLNIGRVYLESGELNLAMVYSETALMKYRELKEDVSEFRALFQIGTVYYKKKEFSQALPYIKEAIVKARQLHRRTDLERFYKLYAGLLSDMGDDKGAVRIYRLYMDIKGKLINEKSSQRIAELQEKYNADKQRAEIEDLKKKNQIDRMQRNVFVLASILLIIILFLLYRRFKYLFQFWKKHSYAGQFRLIEVIGHGGMGIVYKACSIRDKRIFAAVKVLREDLFESEESRKRFRNEAAIIDRLEHPHIVKVFERGDYKGSPYLAMEMLSGETLDQFLKKAGPLEFNLCRRMIRQITETLNFIHQKGVIHRDLKPSNIMVLIEGDHSFFIKLLDFGLAKTSIQSRYTRTGELLGTLVYMSPEQLLSKPLTAASDVYSLGVILYEMVTGGTPHSDVKGADLIYKKLSAHPPDPRRLRGDTPDDLRHLILCMMRKNPRQRPGLPKILEELKF